MLILCKNKECNLFVSIIDDIPRFHQTPLDDSIQYDLEKFRNKKNWSNWRLKNYKFFNKELSNLGVDKKILDIGSGTNTFFDLFSKHNYFSCDFQPFSGQDFCMDVNEKIPLRNDTFDIVILSNVLEHTYDFSNLLSEINRVLKPGGIILIAVPFIIKLHQQPYDFYRYTEYALEKMLSESKFKDCKIISVGNFIENYKFYHHAFRSEIYKANETVFAKIFIKIFYSIYYLIFLMIEKLFIPKELYNRKDYPQGYHCRAEKAE